LTVVSCVNDLRTSCTPWSVFQDGSDERLTRTSQSSPRPTGRRRRLASQQRNRQPRKPPQKEARGEPVLKGDWSKMVERTPGPPCASAWSAVGSAANGRPLARTVVDCQSARSSRAFRWATGGKRQDGAAAKRRAGCDRTEGRPSVNDERSRQAPSSRRAKQRTRCCCDNEREPMLRRPSLVTPLVGKCIVRRPYIVGSGVTNRPRLAGSAQRHCGPFRLSADQTTTAPSVCFRTVSRPVELSLQSSFQLSLAVLVRYRSRSRI
ncbi:hypothetical protein M514_28090, partial [Trichuris suis]